MDKAGASQQRSAQNHAFAAMARPGAGGAVPHLSLCSPNPASAVSLLALLCLSATVGAAASSQPSSTPVTHPGKPLARASESGREGRDAYGHLTGGVAQ